MPEEKKEDGTWGKAVSGVLVALLVGGTTPWWWGKIFGSEEKASENKTVVVDPSSPGRNSASGVSIKQGQSIEVVPNSGFKWACKGDSTTNSYNWVGPGGDGNYTAKDDRAMLPNAPFCGLIARVGQGEWHYLGDNKHTFIADESGNLYLTANDITPSKCPLSDKDECYSDNKGTQTATVSVNVKK